MKAIPLSQGHIAWVDDEDYASVSKFKWSAAIRKHIIYAQRSVQRKGKRAIQLLHQFLLPDAEEVDHRDGDGRNNWKGNLRAVTHSQNGQGFQRKRKGASSRFRGVSWDKENKVWKAQISVNKKTINLGRFNCEEDAARAFDAAALKYRGKFAHLNFPI